RREQDRDRPDSHRRRTAHAMPPLRTPILRIAPRRGCAISGWSANGQRGGAPANGRVVSAPAMTQPESNATPRRTLSEHESKQLVARHGVPIAAERIVQSAAEAAAAAAQLGFPVVVKLCGDAIAHKTERDLVRLGLADAAAVQAAAAELLAKARPEDGSV